MSSYDASKINFKELNECIRNDESDVIVVNALGQRFIAAGLKNQKITIEGTPGNALGAYLNGASIEVCGNAQDAVGDTMNEGEIIIRGNIGDAAGYAMRGGKIYVKGNAGYRAGIHMKEYHEKRPVMVIGGRAGSFLGEYQAGGTIVVLGLDEDINTTQKPIVGNFPCTGMHGGRMFLRGEVSPEIFPGNVLVTKATDKDKEEIIAPLKEFCDLFEMNYETIIENDFTMVVPDHENPYKQMYVAN